MVGAIIAEKKHITECSGRDAEACIDARAVCVPDAKTCIVCNEREFRYFKKEKIVDEFF